MRGVLHVVGAGLAGLACAVAAARAGTRVILYEAAPQAGGRCRSFRDDTLDRPIDNGTHLLIGANRTALAFAEAIGGTEALDPTDPAFPFLDLASGERWELASGRLPAGFAETVAALGLPWTTGGETVAARLGPAPHYRRLWKPLCEAVLNTAPEDASARLFGRVLRSALLGGAEGLRPWLFPAGLSAAF
ncbi:MAG: NAD(P)-binding protein, partial [Pseudomonadota bacterium]